MQVTLGSSSSTALVAVAQLPAIALGNHSLVVPANVPPGSTTVTANAVVQGVAFTKVRVFGIAVAPVMPSVVVPGTSNIVRATTPTLAADQSGCSTINFYDVGPGRALNAHGQLPWRRLQGCDTVRIFAKPAGASYNKMMLISACTNLAPNAPNKFMRVLGVADPISGALPVIDGSNATQLQTRPGQAPRSLHSHHNGNTGDHALYKFGRVSVGPQRGYNYNGGPAQWAIV